MLVKFGDDHQGRPSRPRPLRHPGRTWSVATELKKARTEPSHAAILDATTSPVMTGSLIMQATRPRRLDHAGRPSTRRPRRPQAPPKISQPPPEIGAMSPHARLLPTPRTRRMDRDQSGPRPCRMCAVSRDGGRLMKLILFVVSPVRGVALTSSASGRAGACGVRPRSGWLRAVRRQPI